METAKPIGKAFNNEETAAFCGQMALILKAGISALEGLTLMKEDVSSAEEEKILTFLADQVMDHGSLYQAMSDSGLFPDYALHMVEIGEETGTLDEVMAALQDHYEREDDIRRSIKNAVAYPMIITGMMVVVIIVLLVKVMPIFNQVFIQLGTEMSAFSRALLNLGNNIRTYSVTLVFLLIALIAVILYFALTPQGKKALRSIGYKLPFTRSIFEEIAACRYANALALTLRSGLNPERSMELVNSVNEDEYFKAKLDVCSQLVSDGVDVPKALHQSGIFSGMYSKMVTAGDKSGALDQVMSQIADRYREDVDNRINGVLAILEPTLVVVLSLIVGIILLSVMLPLMGIMSSM